MDKETLNRLGEIRAAMKKYGFDTILGQAAKDKLNPVKSEEESALLLDKEIPVKLRLMLQELGTTFIKFGQLLSTRKDMVGDDIADELAKLQDDNPAISYEEVKEIVEGELNGSIEDLFEDFSQDPLATASIGQVHEAILKSGERVAVKVQKSGITDKIDLDLGIMKFIAMEADKHSAELKKINLPGMMDEFDRSIHKEIDYTSELINMKRVEKNSKHFEKVHIPITYSDYCTSKILTMEFIVGIKISDIYETGSDEFDKKLIAHTLLDSYLTQIFIDGFFHADPHPGNIMVLEDNMVCYLDWGMVGSFDEDFKRDLSQLIVAVMDQDIDGVINQLMFMDILAYDADTKQLKRDLSDLFGRYFGVDLNQFNGILEELMSLMQDYGVILPNELVNMARGVSMVEDIVQHLDPQIDIFASLRPIVHKIMRKRINPIEYFKNKKSNIVLYHHMLNSLPKLLSGAIHKIENGEMIFKFELDRLDAITNKITLALIICALIIGSSMVMTIDKGPMLFGMPLLGAIGFTLSIILGVYTVLKYMTNM